MTHDWYTVGMMAWNGGSTHSHRLRIGGDGCHAAPAKEDP